MSGKIVEGIWDCPYCGADAIGGLQKYCPNCGHPQSEDTRFRLGTVKRYLTEEEIAKVGIDPDWLCDYCESLNNAKFTYCKNCGAERTAENKDYFEMQQDTDTSSNDTTGEDSLSLYNDQPEFPSEAIERLKETTEHLQEMAPETKGISVNQAHTLKDLLFDIAKHAGILALFILIFHSLIGLFTPHEYDAVISGKEWERKVIIEEYRTVEESAWDDVPSGGRLQHTKEEIRSYNKVLSHYETKTRQVAKQVFDGYNTHTYYTNNGNGTFTEHTSKTPKYRTEYVTETYQEPVYNNVPVYDTKYYYETEKWVYDRTEESKGSDNEPYWPEYNLNGNERVSSEKEIYTFKCYVKDKEKVYVYTCKNKDEYDSHKEGCKVKITVVAGGVTEIEKQ